MPRKKHEKSSQQSFAAHTAPAGAFRSATARRAALSAEMAAKSPHKQQKNSRPPGGGLLEMGQTVVKIRLSPSEETLIWVTGCCQLLMIRSAMASSNSFWIRRRRFRAP